MVMTGVFSGTGENDSLVPDLGRGLVWVRRRAETEYLSARVYNHGSGLGLQLSTFKEVFQGCVAHWVAPSWPWGRANRVCDLPVVASLFVIGSSEVVAGRGGFGLGSTSKGGETPRRRL